MESYPTQFYISEFLFRKVETIYDDEGCAIYNGYLNDQQVAEISFFMPDGTVDEFKSTDDTLQAIALLKFTFDAAWSSASYSSNNGFKYGMCDFYDDN